MKTLRDPLNFIFRALVKYPQLFNYANFLSYFKK